MARLGFLILLLAAVPITSVCAECPEEQTAADACCRQILQTAVELKYEPDCISPDHRTPVTVTPCEELCIDAPCHKPVVTRYPCGSSCVEPACHKPAVTAEPCAGCGASTELTGCRCDTEHRECEDQGCDCADCG